MTPTPDKPAATSGDSHEPGGSQPSGDTRARVLEAFLALVAERSFERVGLADVASRAGVSLSDLRGQFGSTFDMLSAFVRDNDRKVLAALSDEHDDAMASQPARDRVFDVMMRRLDILASHKGVLRSLARSACRNPFFALALNRLSVRSAQWMLAAARIDTSGLKGAARAQGLAMVHARVLSTFVRDEDPGLARTMSALDRELSKGERALGLLDSMCTFATCGGRGERASRATSDPAPPVDPVDPIIALR